MSNPHEITLAEAITMTHAYANAPQFQGMTRSVLFNSEAFTDILSQPGCIGIRLYFSLTDQDALTLVMVGSDANNSDMTSGVLMDRTYLCPPFNCTTNSPLM